MKVGDMVTQHYNNRPNDVGLVLKIDLAGPGTIVQQGGGMVTVLWSTDQEERKDRRYRMRDLDVISDAR